MKNYFVEFSMQLETQTMKETYERILTRFQNFVGYNENLDPYMKEMIPLFILHQLIGQGPYEVNENGKVVTNFTSIRGLYFILTNGLLTYGTIESYLGQDVMKYFRQGRPDSLHFGSITVLIGVLHFSNIPSFISKWRPSLDYLKEWSKLNVEFERVIGVRYVYRCEWMIMMSALILPFIWTVFIPLILTRKFGTKWYHTYIPAIIFMSSSIEFLCIVFSFMELSFIGSSINSKLKSLVKGNRLTAEKIHDLRGLWMRCSHVVRLTGRCNAVRWMFDIGSSVMMFSVASFALFSSLVSRNLEISDYTMTIFFAWTRLFFFFEVGELTTHSVGSNIRFTMSTVRIDLLDDRAADEMELFALSISSNYPNININGFTWVSRKVLLAIMEQAMLYILVLIQIQTAR